MRHWGLTYTKIFFFVCYLSWIQIYLGSLLFVGLLNLAAWQEHAGQSKVGCGGPSSEVNQGICEHNQRPRRTEPRPGWGQSNDRRELKRNLGQVVRQLNCQTFEWSVWVMLLPGEFALLIWDPLLPPSSAIWMSLPRFPYLCTTCASVFVLKWIHLTPWINVFQKKTWFPHSRWKNNLTSHKLQVTVNIRTMKLMLLNSNFWLRVWNPLWNSLKSEIGKWWRGANGSYWNFLVHNQRDQRRIAKATTF